LSAEWAYPFSCALLKLPFPLGDFLFDEGIHHPLSILFSNGLLVADVLDPLFSQRLRMLSRIISTLVVIGFLKNHSSEKARPDFLFCHPQKGFTLFTRFLQTLLS
jgi:hypothetical protein